MAVKNIDIMDIKQAIENGQFIVSMQDISTLLERRYKLYLEDCVTKERILLTDLIIDDRRNLIL